MVKIKNIQDAQAPLLPLERGVYLIGFETKRVC